MNMMNIEYMTYLFSYKSPVFSGQYKEFELWLLGIELYKNKIETILGTFFSI